MQTHPITQHQSIRDYLATLDPATVTDIATAAVSGVASAGAVTDWTSETIEHVLTPLMRPIANAGLPTFCITDKTTEAIWKHVLTMPH